MTAVRIARTTPHKNKPPSERIDAMYEYTVVKKPDSNVFNVVVDTLNVVVDILFFT